MSKGSKLVAVRLGEDVIGRLAAAAARRGVTVSEIHREALERWYQAEEGASLRAEAPVERWAYGVGLGKALGWCGSAKEATAAARERAPFHAGPVWVALGVKVGRVWQIGERHEVSL